MFFNQFKSSMKSSKIIFNKNWKKITVSLVSLNPDRHIGGNHFPKTSRIARLTTLATLYAENKQKRVQYGGPREKALSSVTTAISLDLVSPLGRAIRTICNPIIKVDETVMQRATFLSTLLARLCHALVEGFAVVWDVFSSTSDPIFPDFSKGFFCFWKLAIAKTVLGLGIANVVCFISVWYERLGCICTVVVKFLVL